MLNPNPKDRLGLMLMLNLINLVKRILSYLSCLYLCTHI